MGLTEVSALPHAGGERDPSAAPSPMKAPALCLLLAFGCAAAPRPVGVTVVLEGAVSRSPAVRRAVEAPLDPSVELHVARLEASEAPPSAEAPLEARIAAARQAYQETLELDACVDALSDPGTVDAALASGDRGGAARALTYLAACLDARGDAEPAAAVAARLGALGLDVPEAAGGVTPRVETLLSDAVRAAASASRVTFEVRSEPAGARVAIDGLDAHCTTPCERRLIEGDHVVALSRDGSEDAWERVRVAAGGARTIALAPATPERAAAQWRARYGGARDSWPALQLLQTAVRDRRVALLDGGGAGEGGLRLRAALAVDDDVPLRVERLVPPASLAEGTRGVLRDLLTSAGVIPPRPIVEEPLFWIAVAAAAVVAAAITGALLYQPEVRVPVGVLGRAP